MIWDLAVLGGGIMGCATALRTAAAGMSAIVLDQGDLGQGASGVNAGTLSLQIKRVKLMPYALEGHARWAAMGEAVGFVRTGGYTLAFTEAEEALLYDRQSAKAEAGAPISFVSGAALRAAEPALSPEIRAASYCAEDGYANSALTGQVYRRALRAAGVAWRERAAVTEIDASDGFALVTAGETVRARRLLLAAGGWLKGALAMLGLDLPVRARINTVSVTERGPRLVSTVIGHATGLLTLKQKANGTVLIGGGWQGRADGDRGAVDADSLVPNLALAAHTVPGLGALRVVRSWTGYEANVPDFYPLAGALPIPGAYVLGCVRGGYTIGPYLGELMGDLILGRTPERPLFDPMRAFTLN